MTSSSKMQEKILIIGPAWVGDMVMAQSLFITLKRRYPDSHLSVLAPAWTKPLLDRMPEVDASFDLPFGHGELKLSARRRFGLSLRDAGYTRAIVLPNSFKSALIPFFAGIPVRTGWRGEARGWLLNDCRRLDKHKYPQMAQRFAALAFSADAPPVERVPDPRLLVRRPDVDRVLARFGIAAPNDDPSAPMPKRLIAVCPGAEFGPSKQWPAAHFIATCADLIVLGWRIVIMGSAGDQAVAQEIEAGIVTKLGTSGGAKSDPRCFNVAGKTTLEEAIDLMAACTTALSNDSGLMHVAAALDLPVVALYGSTSPDFTPPLATISRVLSTDINCRPCFERTCRFGHNRCMTELAPARASSAVIELDLK